MPDELEPPELDDPELVEVAAGGELDDEDDDEPPPPQPAMNIAIATSIARRTVGRRSDVDDGVMS